MEKIFLINESDLQEVISKTIQKELENFSPIIQSTESELITRHEAARILNISLPTLNAYSKEGRIKSYRIGSRIRYKRNEVIESLQAVQTFKYR